MGVSENEDEVNLETCGFEVYGGGGLLNGNVRDAAGLMA